MEVQMSVDTEIMDLAQRYLDKVKSSGSGELTAVCPFHTKADGSPERNPSFYMSTTSGLFFCHSCKAKGNLRHFLKAMGVSTPALRTQYGHLLDAAAKEAPSKTDPTRKRVVTTEEPLPESLLGIFDKCPLDLIKEGFTEETLQEFDVGFDEQHMRITFPLRDLAGRLVGISGRTVVGNPRRYKIYDSEYKAWGLPMRQVPKMGEILWNADRIYPEVYFGRDVPLVVVEGFKACMWLHQAGIKNVVALCGSYLKEGQQWLLEHLGGLVYIMLDNGDAGATGAQQCGAALSKSLKTRMVFFRESANQPTDLGQEEIVEALGKADDYYLWAMKLKG
jgi:DNA primase